MQVANEFSREREKILSTQLTLAHKRTNSKKKILWCLEDEIKFIHLSNRSHSGISGRLNVCDIAREASQYLETICRRKNSKEQDKSTKRDAEAGQRHSHSKFCFLLFSSFSLKKNCESFQDIFRQGKRESLKKILRWVSKHQKRKTKRKKKENSMLFD